MERKEAGSRSARKLPMINVTGTWDGKQGEGSERAKWDSPVAAVAVAWVEALAALLSRTDPPPVILPQSARPMLPRGATGSGSGRAGSGFRESAVKVRGPRRTEPEWDEAELPADETVDVGLESNQKRMEGQCHIDKDDTKSEESEKGDGGPTRLGLSLSSRSNPSCDR